MTADRRTFLKSLAALPLLGAAGKVTAYEKEIQETGRFESGDGIFHPVYERHDERETKTPTKIPPDFDALSIEGIFTYNFLTLDPQKILFSYERGQDTEEKPRTRTVPREVLDILGKDPNKLIAFGDVAYSQNVAFELATDIIKSAILYGVLQKAFRGVSNKSPQGEKMNRREFFTKTAKTLTIIAASSLPLMNNVTPDLLQPILMDAIKNDLPEARVLAKLESTSYKLDPGNLNNVFRELVQANKLLEMATYLKGHIHRKPIVAFNWHWAHIGIEDWLKLDRQTLRNCIMAFPDPVLKGIIEANDDDPKKLTTIRALRLLDKPTLNIGEQFIEDRVLYQMLVNRGLAQSDL